MKGKPLLKFEGRLLGRFVERPNRFLARVRVEGQVLDVHVHDPGRLKEPLFPGNEVAIIRREGRRRKTKYDLIGAKREEEWAFIHSGYHSEIAEKLIKSGKIRPLRGYDVAKGEVKLGNSRIDFVLDPKAFLEVKGCTLIRNSLALFPDAPTERGRRHILELERELEKGIPCFVLFLVFGSAERFSPNWETDPRFSDELLRASEMGLKVIAYSLTFDSVNLFPRGEIKVDIRKG